MTTTACAMSTRLIVVRGLLKADGSGNMTKSAVFVLVLLSAWTGALTVFYLGSVYFHFANCYQIVWYARWIAQVGCTPLPAIVF